MRLSKLTIKNHSRLRDLDIQIREHMVVVGANDVGKTSMLRCLQFLLGASVQQLYQGLRVEDLRDPADPMLVRATLIDFSDDERALFPDEISIAGNGDESLDVELIVELDPDDAEQLAMRRHFPDGGGRSPTRDQLDGFGWQYLPATRSSNVDFMEGRRSPLKTMLAATDLGNDCQKLEEALDGFNIRLGENDALTSLREQLADHLSRSMPKSVEASELTLRTTTDPKTDVLDEVTLFLNTGEGVRALAEQSDGVRQLMTMTFFDLAQSSANIVAVDEPELHLHASSQRTIAELFAAGSSQRLLVTHSPYIVQRFEPKHVVVVTAERETRQIHESSFSSVEKEMANWWSPRLLEALTARHVLMVEGAADRVFIESCARAQGINLDRLGITILELDGADKFGHVNKLLGKSGFALSLIGLVDKKESGSWINGMGLKPKDVNLRGIFVCDADLEDEYSRGMGAASVARSFVSEGVCKEKSILQSAGVASISDLDSGAMAKFAREGGRKVTGAVAVGKHVSKADIAAMPAVSGLLDFLSGL
jgi:putative ATP-dependent endonuclease of OLD family